MTDRDLQWVERIRRAEDCFRSHTVDKEAFKARLRQRLQEEVIPPVSSWTGASPAAQLRGVSKIRALADGADAQGPNGARRIPHRTRRLANLAMGGVCVGGAVALTIVTVAVMEPSGVWRSAANPGGTNPGAEAPVDPYFGGQLPFQPVLPARVPSGYSLASSGVEWERRDGQTVFQAFEAQFQNPAVKPKQGPTVMDIREFPGDSVDAAQVLGSLIQSPVSLNPIHVGRETYRVAPGRGGDAQVTPRTVRIGGQTYYLSDAWPSWVGFVRNHVVYFLSVPYDHWSSQLLTCAQAMTRPAPVRWSERSSVGTAEAAAANVSFRPIVPKLGAEYVATGVGSQVFRSAKGQSEYVVYDFRSRSKPAESVQVVEWPMTNASNPFEAAAHLRWPATGPSLETWKDGEHQLLWVIQSTLPKGRAQALMASIQRAVAGS
ncbi:MAG: hypothetical protein K6T30_10135 [Alicyclobacillus sp.]|nr:hypothetical protein [Alicyclobacillus sp.]